MLGGFNYQYDLASNASARKADNLVKLKPYDFSIEAGIGFQFFFPVFILSPELKISNGLINVHSRDPNLIYSNTIDKLNSRMIVFSLIFGLGFLSVVIVAHCKLFVSSIFIAINNHTLS